jgi:hypothetical protein
MSKIVPFDPFTSPIIRPSWYKKIKLYVAPKETRIYGRSLEGTGKCCCFFGWNSGKADPHGCVRVDGVKWYIHRYVYSKYHNVDLSPTEIVDHICRRRLCFNPLHTECTDHHTNYERGLGPAHLIQNSSPLSDEEIPELLG